MFIWERVDYATDNYHNEGAVVVTAADLDAARALIPTHRQGVCEAMTKEPDAVYELASDAPPRAFVFQDAGCC